MILSEPTVKDVPAIVELNRKQDFNLTNIDNCIIDRVVYDNDKVIAYGIVKEMSEAIILVNLEVPKISRMKALQALMKVAIFGAQSKGHEQLHVFVKDTKVAKLLIDKFHFQEVEDICLVRNL